MAPSPADWRDTLVRRLDARWNEIRRFDDYYEGRQELAYATQKFRESYGGLFTALSDNWCQIVVDASVERLRVQGFRFGKQEDADEDAWRIWQANNLDGQSNMLHTEAVKLSEAYWMVQPNKDTPRITAEHPSQVIVECDPSDRRKRIAALKKWRGSDGRTYANVYLPSACHKYVTRREPFVAADTIIGTTKWESLGMVPNKLGVVPIIPAPNNPSMIHGGRSDLDGGVLTIQDAINKLCADLLVGSESTAFRQRILMGVDQPKDPATGRPIPIDQAEGRAIASKVLMIPGKDAKAVEFGETDLRIIRDAIDGLVRDLTAQTRTPPHYVAGQIVNASGDALKAAETGLVSKVRDKMDPFGEAHEEAMRLAFRAIDPDDPRAEATDAETIWRDPESRTEGETVDAAIKLRGLLPDEMIMERIGLSPQEIERAMTARAAQALIAPPPVTEPDAAQPTQPPAN